MEIIPSSSFSTGYILQRRSSAPQFLHWAYLRFFLMKYQNPSLDLQTGHFSRFSSCFPKAQSKDDIYLQNFIVLAHLLNLRSLFYYETRLPFKLRNNIFDYFVCNINLCYCLEPSPSGLAVKFND